MEAVNLSQFKNVVQLLDYFQDDNTCKLFLANQRWGDQICCPHCGNAGKIWTTNRGYRCTECDKKFSVTTGTFYENTKIKLRYWFAAIYLLSAHKKGISSLQLHRDLGISQKSTWFMLMRIRAAMSETYTEKLKNTVECDEVFIGGKNKNRHAKKKVEGSQGRSTKDKTPVIGMVERGGKIRAFKIPNTQIESIQPCIEEHIEKGARVMTDEWHGYNKVNEAYDHTFVNHKAHQYVVNDTHTNTVEGFWSLLKRGIIGIYHYTSSKHLNRYCDEFSYRYNTRDITDCDRFCSLLAKSNGGLTYEHLVYGQQ